MNRREFSAGAAVPGRCRRPRPAAAGLCAQGKPEDGTRVPDPRQAGPRRGARRQDRGDRVLLVQLPALQRVRAPAGSVGQEAAAPTCRSGACRWPFATTSCPSSACSTRSRPWASWTNCTRKVFHAIHAEHQPINREGGPILAWAEQARAWTRPSSRSCTTPSRCPTKARKATQLQEAFQVQGVPAIGVAGRYYTDGDLAGNMDRALAGHRLPDRRSAQAK